MASLDKGRCSNLDFHNRNHTKEVVKAVKKIGCYEGLSNEELEPIIIAAYFHDTGLRHVYKGHEYVSASNAKQFLEVHNYPKEKIKIVMDCILATQMPQSPNNKYEEIICDADLSHLGSRKYFKKNEKLRKEWNVFMKLSFDDTKWKQITIDFLMEHNYLTTYGKEVLRLEKRANVIRCMAGVLEGE